MLPLTLFLHAMHTSSWCFNLLYYHNGYFVEAARDPVMSSLTSQLSPLVGNGEKWVHQSNQTQLHTLLSSLPCNTESLGYWGAISPDPRFRSSLRTRADNAISTLRLACF